MAMLNVPIVDPGMAGGYYIEESNGILISNAIEVALVNY
jgi:hypothetical protein